MSQLRERGVYELKGVELIATRRSDVLYFLFTPENWNFRGPVDFRLSHGRVYAHGEPTAWSAADLLDTGRTAEPPSINKGASLLVRARRD